MFRMGLSKTFCLLVYNILMKKNFIFCSILIIVALLAIGCAGSNDVKSQPFQAKTGRKAPNILFVSGSASGPWVKIAAGIADMVNEYFEGYPVTATPGGSTNNPLVLYYGQAQIGMSYGPLLLLAQEGKDPYDKKIGNLRAVGALTPTVVHIIADPSIPVDNVSDLVKKKIQIRIGLPPKGQGSNYIAQQIFAELGYSDIDKIKDYGSSIFYGERNNLDEAWKYKHINVYFVTYNVPDDSVSNNMLARKDKLLNINQDLKKGLLKKGFSAYTIPAGTYPGQNMDIETVANKIIVFAREDVPEEVIYYLTKAMYENKATLEGLHSSFKEFRPQEMLEGVTIPLHKGAEKFYKEVGLLK